MKRSRGCLRTPREPDGVIHHAQLAVGEGAVMLVGQRQGGGDVTARRTRLFVPVRDAEAHLQRPTRAGAKVINASRDCAPCCPTVFLPAGRGGWKLLQPAWLQWTDRVGPTSFLFVGV